MGSVLWYWKLDLKFVRAVNDWEIEGIANLLKVLWKGVKEETFLVNEGFCLQLVSGSLMSQLKLPFYSWEAVWSKDLTLDKLQRRGWHLPNMCLSCGCKEEMIQHILLHCPIVSARWEIVFSLVGNLWVFPKTVREALTS